MGYEAAGFTDAQEALTAFAAAPDEFDLVVTDMAMPRMTGIDFAQQVLAIRPDIPVLLASGYVRPGRGGTRSPGRHPQGHLEALDAQ